MNYPIIASERAHAINGVDGRYFGATVGGSNYKPGTFTVQRWMSHGRPIGGYGKDAMLSVECRYDDQCRNGHNTFAITADVRRPRARDIEAGECLHDDIARVFPELAPLIQWHLVSADGPMHYLANAVYLAGDRDYRGLRAGETRQLRDRKTGTPCWRMAYVDATGAECAKPETYLDSETAPIVGARLAYVPWTVGGEGKARELDVARRVACWPDATDSELCAEPDSLRAALAARLPALLARFREAMESAGFLWAPPVGAA